MSLARYNYGLAESILPIATINRTAAESIKSSIHDTGLTQNPMSRLDSIYGVFPKMVMAERNRHRAFSLSDRSSRAVPPEKLIEEIRRGVGLAMPAKFRRRTTGMGGGEELAGDELIEAQLDWIMDALNAADGAERAMKREAKETVNRRLDMYIYAHTLMTGTRAGWLNYLGLRLDGGADPTIQVFAQRCFEVYKATTPKELKPGQWHLPFVSHWDEVEGWEAIHLSAARSAHLSYNDLETGQRMTLERAILIAGKLKDSTPLHASPFEHQATPDNFEYLTGITGCWIHPNEHGNLYGWRQARKMIPGEAIAPLPAGYEL